MCIIVYLIFKSNRQKTFSKTVFELEPDGIGAQSDLIVSGFSSLVAASLGAFGSHAR